MTTTPTPQQVATDLRRAAVAFQARTLAAIIHGPVTKTTKGKTND